VSEASARPDVGRRAHRRSRRPCHPRAISSGNERYVAVNHGHSDRTGGLGAPSLTWGEGEGRNCMACKGSTSASRPRVDQRLREGDPHGKHRPCRARPTDSGPGREEPERRRCPRPDRITKSVCELSTGWSGQTNSYDRILTMSSLIATPAHVHIQIAGPWPSVAIASLALLFTVGSFWWLNARQGRLKSSEPQSFAACRTPDKLRLLFPLVIYNSGATPIIVQDMQLNFPRNHAGRRLYRGQRHALSSRQLMTVGPSQRYSLSLVEAPNRCSLNSGDRSRMLRPWRVTTRFALR
jgi:hypothetical protein